MYKKFQSSKLHEVDDQAVTFEPEKDGFMESAECVDELVFYQAAENVVSRNIAGETVLVPVGEQAGRVNGFATFTETGQFLWTLLSERKCTKTELSIKLAKAYQQPQEKVQKDVEVYLEKMVNYGFVVQCG